MIKKIRSYFLTGLVVSAPVAITLAVGWWFINKIDAIFTPLLPNKFLPENLLLIYQQMKFSGLEEKFAKRLVIEAQKNIEEAN